MQVEEPSLEQWVAWLTMDAPRRLTPATICEYHRQLARFARWLETTLGLPFLPKHVTAYRAE